jgi:hypothetical protein
MLDYNDQGNWRIKRHIEWPHEQKVVCLVVSKHCSWKDVGWVEGLGSKWDASKLDDKRMGWEGIYHSGI